MLAMLNNKLKMRYQSIGKYYLNTYKTSQHYGEQVIDVQEKAPEFYKLLQKWVKINPTDYLLFF